MTFGKASETQYILRFEKGEDVVSTLTAFCVKQHIENAEVHGIGSIEKPTLAHYRVDTKKYSDKLFDGIYEVTSLLGTIALSENQPLPHLHATISDETMHVYGGHLVSGTVSATLEMTVTVLPSQFTKSPNEEIGLKLYDLPEKLEN